MAADPENAVTVDGGVLYLAPVGTDLPEAFDDTLDPAFRDLGYWSSDGATITPVPGDTTTITAHNGDVVIEKTAKGNVTLLFPFIELNQQVFETFWDTEIQPDGSYEIEAGAANKEYALVYDRLFSDGTADRQVSPRVRISDRAGVPNQESAVLTHSITFGTLKHADYPFHIKGFNERFALSS